MSWKVTDYLKENPNASVIEVIAHFAGELEVDQQIQHLQQEVEKATELREELRPLYAEKMNLVSNLTVLESDFEMQVMMKYPPRQGSDKERKAYKRELQQAHPDYPKMAAKVETLDEQIQGLEQKVLNIQQSAKNGRRLIETFNGYLQFLLHIQSETIATIPKGNTNSNLF